MSVLQITKSANALDIWFDDIKMYLVLDDGRELSVPINWFHLFGMLLRNKEINGDLLAMWKEFIGKIWMKVS